MFQSYALFPHLTVFENVAFGLRRRKVAGAELDKRVKEALAMVRLAAFGERYPRQLSGGQQQRVAIARALAPQPRVLLFDEPLSNLDAQLRDEMQIELKRLQRGLGITTLFVTHDQGEALSMSDRVGVMAKGVMQQFATPEEIYHRPATGFVASFIGKPNRLSGTVAARNGKGGSRALGAAPSNCRPPTSTSRRREWSMSSSARKRSGCAAAGAEPGALAGTSRCAPSAARASNMSCGLPEASSCRRDAFARAECRTRSRHAGLARDRSDSVFAMAPTEPAA